MKTTESGQMNQNTELVKRLEELADAGPLIHCQSWSYIQRICMKSAVTLSTQERVIEELRETLEGLCSIVQYSVNRLDATGNQPQVAADLAVNLAIARDKVGRALSKGSGQ